MEKHFLEILLFLLPGVLAESLYCRLSKNKLSCWSLLIGMLTFSMFNLLLRCVLSVAGGYGSFEVNIVFQGIGNFVKYCFLSIFMVIFIPPCAVVVDKIFERLREPRKDEEIKGYGGEKML